MGTNKDSDIVYTEPSDYFPKEVMDILEGKTKPEQKQPRNNIEDFKDRMTSPVRVTRIDPETGEPINPNEDKIAESQDEEAGGYVLDESPHYKTTREMDKE